MQSPGHAKQYSLHHQTALHVTCTVTIATHSSNSTWVQQHVAAAMEKTVLPPWTDSDTAADQPEAIKAVSDPVLGQIKTYHWAEGAGDVGPL